jgi:hypothetical protein
MISNGCTDANGKVLVEGVGENLLPTAQACRLWRPGPAIAAPSTRDRHIDVLCDLTPGQPSVTKLEDLLRRRRMRRSAATHCDTSTT